MGIGDVLKTDRGTVSFLVWGLVMIAVSGLFFSMAYFVMDLVGTSLENTNCIIENNAFFDECQDIWELAVYPFLALKTVLVYLSMFFIAILIAGMLLSGYNSGTRPYMLGVILLLNIALTYASLWVANIYRDLLGNAIILQSMTHFSVYNNIMLNFPWYVFIITLFSLALGVVNWQRAGRNTEMGDLNY